MVMLPKIIVILIFLLIILGGRRTFIFSNRYIFSGLILLAVLGLIFSDSIYNAVNRKVMTYVGAPANLPFISEKWKRTGLKNPDDNTRDRMVPGLMMHRKLLGKSKEAIFQMLGRPENTHNFPEWNMEYYLGHSLYSSNTRWLVISLNENDEVTDYTVQEK